MGLEERPTSVGTTRPEIRKDWIQKSRVSRFLARCEYGAAHFFYWFNTVALFRLLIRAVTVGVLFVTLWGIYQEFQQRKIDSGVRVATLFAQIARSTPFQKEKVWEPSNLVSKLLRAKACPCGASTSAARISVLRTSAARY